MLSAGVILEDEEEKAPTKHTAGTRNRRLFMGRNGPPGLLISILVPHHSFRPEVLSPQSAVGGTEP